MKDFIYLYFLENNRFDLVEHYMNKGIKPEDFHVYKECVKFLNPALVIRLNLVDMINIPKSEKMDIIFNRPDIEISENNLEDLKNRINVVNMLEIENKVDFIFNRNPEKNNIIQDFDIQD